MLGLYIGAFLGMLSETSMNIALPDLCGAFNITTGTAQWMVVGIVVVAFYAYRQLHIEHPVLELRALGIATFRVPALMVTCLFACTLALMFLAPQELQRGLGLDSSTAGMLMLAGGVVNAIFSFATGRMYDRVGARPMVRCGAMVAVIGSLLFLAIGVTTAPAFFVLAHVVFMIGIPLMQQSAQSAALKGLPRELAADGSAILNTMQTPALFALKNQLLEGEPKAKMIDRLRENFAQHDLCLQTGFLGTSILMATLTENGMEDIAYELLFQRKNPSWLYSVDNGATTIWERWNSYMIDKGMGPRGMNSFNHYAYGCVCEWIWETVAGIAADPATPGFKHIIMKPIPDKRLGHVTAEYRSASGLIKSAWKYEGDTWIWEFTIPKGVTATVTLPGEVKSKEYGSGTYKVTK